MSTNEVYNIYVSVVGRVAHVYVRMYVCVVFLHTWRRLNNHLPNSSFPNGTGPLFFTLIAGRLLLL